LSAVPQQAEAGSAEQRFGFVPGVSLQRPLMPARVSYSPTVARDCNWFLPKFFREIRY